METLLKVTVTCNECGNDSTFDVPSEGFHKWIKGELIQRAMPDLSTDHREMLLSNICPKCWDNMFKDTEEEFDPSNIFDED